MKLIPNEATRKIARTILVAKKNSPHLFFAGGLAGSIASTVLACRATLKLEPVLDEIKMDLQIVNAEKENRDQKQHTFALLGAYGRSAKSLGKLYGPSVALNVVSIGMLTGSHVQQARRNSVLTATAAAFAKSYDDYRERVREEIGADKELELHHGLMEDELTVDGKKQIALVGDPNNLSPFSRIFDESSPEYKRDPELNRFFVQAQQNFANHLLQARGHVFLNEVYDALGLERSRAGAVMGWVLGDDCHNYVDFGMFEPNSARFVNNMEQSIILDFNIDGVIYNKI